MSKILALIDFPVAEEQAAREFHATYPDLCWQDYRWIMREIPNLHYFFLAVSATFPDRSVTNTLWFRIWYQVRQEIERGESHTLDLLRKVPHMDDRVVELNGNIQSKRLTHCLKVLHGLIACAHQPYF